MIDLKNSKLFEAVTDAQSGVTSYILKEHVATLEKCAGTFAPMHTPDGRYYWFLCAYPPAGRLEGASFYAAVIDFAQNTVRYFKDVQPKGMPAVHPVTGELYFATATMILKRGPKESDGIELAKLSDRAFYSRVGISDMLSFNHDGTKLTYVSFDDRRQVSTLYELTLATGEVAPLCQMPGYYGKALAAPDGSVLFEKLPYSDPRTGAPIPIGMNDDGQALTMWKWEKGCEEASFVAPKYLDAAFPWFDAQGRLCYTDFIKGIIVDGEKALSRFGIRHAHGENGLYVYDVYDLPMGESGYDGCGASVYAQKGDTAVRIASLPALYESGDPCVYDIAPAPRLVCNGRLIAYTTRHEGRVTLAFVPVETLPLA